MSTVWISPSTAAGSRKRQKALSSPDIDLDRLASYAGRIGNSGVVRRLGYLAELKGLPIELPSIDPSNYLMLDPTMPHEGKRNARWRLIVNLDEKMLEGQE